MNEAETRAELIEKLLALKPMKPFTNSLHTLRVPTTVSPFAQHPRGAPIWGGDRGGVLSLPICTGRFVFQSKK